MPARPFHYWTSLAVPAIAAVFLSSGGSLAASGSCRIDVADQHDCMEFSGPRIPEGIKAVCTIAGGSTWFDAPCPQENVLGFCEVPRTDGIIQRIYCYRMADISDTDTLSFCRISCKGDFVIAAGKAPSAPPQPATPAPQEKKYQAVSKPSTPLPVNLSTIATTAVLEEDTNRPGEDYKDLDLETPDPLRCAELCQQEELCRAWTYVKPGIQSEHARCWLKNSVPPPLADENCVSGMKREPTAR